MIWIMLIAGRRVAGIGRYYLHHVDPAVPLTDSVGALGRLRDEGKITAPGP
jgi:aryl-alcohol dehydrogenase-like predicted oxidoreductase